jgi:hypothetical protein
MTNIRVVDELGYGVYIATDEVTGKHVVNEDFQNLQVASKKGDQKKIDALMRAAKQCGIINPGFEYVDGARPVSDDEWEDQRSRLESGETPDKYDLGSLISEYKYEKEFGGK